MLTTPRGWRTGKWGGLRVSGVMGQDSSEGPTGAFFYGNYSERGQQTLHKHCQGTRVFEHLDFGCSQLF